MPYVTDARPIMERAFRERFTIVAFNVAGLEMVRGCVDAAEAEKAPVMLQTSPGELAYGSPEVFCRMVQAIAERSHVPVMMHLDHGDSVQRIAQCIRAGYSSIMFDGENLKIDENVTATNTVAAFAHGAGVCVEAAAGSFGGGEGNTGDVTVTDPADAKRLWVEGNADMVACSVGSRHGESSNLDFGRLEAIYKMGNAPIVLHGGTGIDAQDVRQATTLGVVKLNIGSALVRTTADVWRVVLASDCARMDTNMRVVSAIREIAREKIQLTNSSKKAL